MADIIIAQKSSECKVVNSLSNSTNLTNLIAAEVLRGTNERAADILGACGFNGLIPGAFFAPVEEVIAFFGVTKEYLRSAFLRHKIGARNTPEDILNDKTYKFLSSHTNQERYMISRPAHNKWSFLDKYTKDHRMLTIEQEKTTFCSARIILAMSALLYYGRRIPDNSVVLDVFKRLKNTSYYAEACKKERENTEKIIKKYHEEEEKQQKAVVVSNDEEVIALDSNKNLSIPINTLVKLVVVAAKAMNTGTYEG